MSQLMENYIFINTIFCDKNIINEYNQSLDKLRLKGGKNEAKITDVIQIRNHDLNFINEKIIHLNASNVYRW